MPPLLQIVKNPCCALRTRRRYVYTRQTLFAVLVLVVLLESSRPSGTVSALSLAQRKTTPAFAKKRRQNGLPTSRLQMTSIYYPSDWVDDDDEEKDVADHVVPDGILAGDDGGRPIITTTELLLDPTTYQDGPQAFIEHLYRHSMDRLARLAAAFAPTHLNLADITAVHVLHLDATQLNLEAVVCEHDGCVTLNVPILFDDTCDVNSVDIESCVEGHLDTLDGRAQQVLQSQEYNENVRDGSPYNAARQQEMRQELDAMRGDKNNRPNDDDSFELEYAVDDLPTWWQHCGTNEDLATECRSIMRLLNDEEFADDLLNVAKYVLLPLSQQQQQQPPVFEDNDIELDDDDDEDVDKEENDDNDLDDYDIVSCKAVAIGPAGILLRILAQEYQILDRPVERYYLDVPVRFHNVTAAPIVLRDTVLDLVDVAAAAATA